MTLLKKLAPIGVSTTLLLGFAGGASAYQCKSTPEVAAATLANPGTALMASKSAWTAKVRGKFGLEWSVYNIAANASQNCLATGGGIMCTVIAKPCKYVVQ